MFSPKRRCATTIDNPRALLTFTITTTTIIMTDKLLMYVYYVLFPTVVFPRHHYPMIAMVTCQFLINKSKYLYIFIYKYLLFLQGADLTKPIDKKLYKGISPTCHDFNSTAVTEDSLPLIVGFSTGLVQLIDPVRKDVSVLFNEEVSYIF